MENKIVASEPKYKMVVEKNVMVTARDGVKLAVDIYRPDAPGEKFPGLYTVSVYGKDTQNLPIPPQEFGGSIFEASIEAGDIEYFVTRGYVYCVADFRGIGSSEGTMWGMFDVKEWEDSYDIIEWLAVQDYCNGKVAGIGTCYFGFTQLMAAETKPPHLVTITPFELNFEDFYELGLYTGGVLHLVWYGLYSGTHPARIGLAPKDIQPSMVRDLSPEELEKRVEEALKDPNLRQYPYLYQILQYPYKNPIVFDFLLNPTDSEWYRQRSYGEQLDKIEIPTWVGGPFHGPFGISQTSVFNKLTNTKVKKLDLFTAMDPRPWKSRSDELLRWYDYWLKDMETGIMDEPLITVETPTGEVLHPESWPPADQEELVFYMHQKGKLLPFVKTDLVIDEPDSFLQRPFFVSEERGKLVYRTPPLAEDVVLAGSPRLKFYASIDQPDTTWRIDLFEGGHESPWPITKGWLRASMRKRVPEKDTPWLIAHDFTKKELLEPGKIEEYEIQFRPAAYVFKAGTSIEIEISCVDIPLDETSYDEMWHFCEAQTCLHKIYRDLEHQSQLIIPVLPAKK